jgi:hypothetical protein
MPYAVRKMPNRNCYKVFNKNTKKVFAKCTSVANAQKQLRLLRAIQYNPKFRSKLKRVTKKNVGGKTRKKYKRV